MLPVSLHPSSSPLSAFLNLPLYPFITSKNQHPYQLYLALNDIEHTKTKANSPQTNGICERFHKTILQEFYQITFRKKLYADIDALQKDLDAWMCHYNRERTHQGKMGCGRTPWQTWLDSKELWKQKVDALNQHYTTVTN